MRDRSGPVRSFVVPIQAGVVLAVQKRGYVGYPLTFSIRTQGLEDGAPVVIERRAGGRWARVTGGTVRKNRAGMLGLLPKGKPEPPRDGADRRSALRLRVANRPGRKGAQVDDGARHRALLRHTGGGLPNHPRRTGAARLPRKRRDLLHHQHGHRRNDSGRPCPGAARDDRAGRPVLRILRPEGDRGHGSGRIQGRKVTGTVELSIGQCVGGGAISVRRIGPRS